MSQSLYTAMGGVSAAQTSLNVISNNVANINTTAFKSSSTNFSEVYCSTLSSGTAASGTTGGINPMQVGLGVQVSSISKDFSSGTWVATGKTTDMMIEGEGFFTVQSSDGQKFYTRAGDFHFDSDGDLVTSTGFKVVGTGSLLATTTSTVPVHIPQKIVREVIPNSASWNEALTNLNNCTLTSGNFVLSANGTSPLTLNINTTTNPTMGQVAASLQAQLTAATTFGATCTTQAADATAAAAALPAVGGNITALISTTVTTAANEAKASADTAYAAGLLTQAQYNATTSAITSVLSNLPAVGTAITAGDIAAITTAETTINTNLAAIAANPATAIWESNFANITVTCDATTNGTIQFGVDGSTVTSLKFQTASTNQSNFLNQTGFSTATISGNTYTSKALDFTVDVRQVTNIEDATAINSYSIGDDGSIEATYANGDTLAVTLSGDGNTYEFKYTTAEGIKILGDKVGMDPNVASVANFVLQLASITNNEGLLSVGNNMFSAGPNCGDIIYSVGTKMGLGNVSSGGLEASNVDLSAQFASMILSQRAVQANSRVFSTTSDIMDVIVNMGR